MIVKGTVKTNIRVRVCKAEPWYCLPSCRYLLTLWSGVGSGGLARCRLFKHRLTTHHYEDRVFYHRCKKCCDACKVPKEGDK
jgi:hypothetical protein